MRNCRLALVPCILVAALALLTAREGEAQMVRGTFVGTVKDSQGAVLSGARVTVTETETNTSRSTTTNASGNYSLPSVLAGTYRVEAELDGFKKAIQEAVALRVNTTVRVDLQLEVGALAETVEVTSEAQVLQTDRADTGREIDSVQIVAVPLGNNRNFQNLLQTVPGATRPTRQNSEFFNIQDSLESKVNGQSRFSNNWMIEGIDNTDKTGYRTMIIPPAEAIETVSVSTSNFDAEYGRAGGAVTAVTLKSGTNQLRGTAFYFGNTEATQAGDYFTHTKGDTNYQQFGGTLGGPIVKDKLFFFGDYQYTKDDLGRVYRFYIPPSEWRGGNFSSASTTIYNPFTGNADGTGRVAFPGNTIPGNMMSPIAQNILAFLPAPNVSTRPDGSPLRPGDPNFEKTVTRTKTTHAFDVKLTFVPTAGDQLTARFSYAKPELFDPNVYGIYGGPAGGGTTGTGTQEMYSGAVTWTRTLSNTLILDVRAGVSHYDNTQRHEGMGSKTSQEVGIPNANTDDYFTDGLALINIGQGFSQPTLGFSPSTPWDRGETWKSVAATLTKLKGNHTIKFGLDGRHNRDFLRQYQDAGGARGRFTFGAAQTSIPTDTKAQNSAANALAAFLLDAPSGTSRDIRFIENPGTEHYVFATYLQDVWQVSKSLTLNLGLRWEFYTPLKGLDTPGGLSNYNPKTNSLEVAGYGDVAEDLGVQKTWDNFAPRLGATYRFDEKTVARAGFGTTVIPFPENRYAYNFPVKQNNQYNSTNSFGLAPRRMVDGFPAPSFYEIPENGIIDANVPFLKSSGLTSVPTDLEEAKLHSWNVAIQRMLPWKLAAELAYVGNVGRGILVVDYNLNAGLVPGADSDGQPFKALYGRTASVNSWAPTDTSYNGLQAKLDRRFSGGFLLTNSYTLSRTTNYTDDNQSGNYAYAKPEISKGPAGYDRTHTFSSSFVFDLPWFKGRGGALEQLLGGWQVAGVFFAASGTPLDITTSSATLRAPGNPQRPDLKGDQAILGGKGPGQKWFDTSVYSAPPPSTFGSMTRNSGPRGPGFWNLDASLAKRFRFTTTVNLELRADAFNLTNSAQWNNPNTSFGAATFGEINGVSNRRLVRFGARLTF